MITVILTCLFTLHFSTIAYLALDDFLQSYSINITKKNYRGRL